MSQALENKEGDKNNQEVPCIKCNARHENNKYESMCPDCFNQSKASSQLIPNLADQKDNEQANFTTPTKLIKEQLTLLRQKQLIEAPRKPPLKRYQSKQSNENENGEELASNSLERNHIERSSLQNGPQNFKEQQSDVIKIENIRMVSSKKPQVCSNDNNQSQRASKLEPIFGRKLHIKRKRETQELNEEDLKAKKRDYEQFSSIKQSIKGKCSFCKKKTGLLGVSCSHCNLVYCNSHRLPQNHNCEVDFAEEEKKKRRDILTSILPKHKGKIPEI